MHPNSKSKSIVRISVQLLALIVATKSAHAVEPPGALSLKDALDHAESYHPALKVSAAYEAEARAAIGVRESAYYPHLGLEAVDSTGFPGSTSALGVSGLMGSPFRSGASFGAVVTQDIWDFGRTTNSVREAKSFAKGQAEGTRIARYDLDDHVIQAYFDCALNRAQADTWAGIVTAAHLVSQEVDRFVRTGQRSIVDGYLSRTQEQSAVAFEASYSKRAEISAQRLGVLLGTQSTLCPSVTDMNSSFGFNQAAVSNPYVEYEKQLTEAAKARLGAANADYLPKLIGIGSVGMLEDTHLLPKNDYSLGVGIVFPLFEGFVTKSQVEQSAALVTEHESKAQVAEVGVAESNARYDENILSAKAKLHQLDEEVKLANKAFDTAKTRYFNLQGTLIDVRSALDDLSRVLTDRNSVLALYLSESSRKQILNGAR